MFRRNQKEPFLNAELSEKAFTGIMGVLILTFIALNIARMYFVPLTVDEAPNRTDLLLSYWDIITLKRVTANTHILNSILRKFFIEVLGNTPFCLRLPSLIAHSIFLFVLSRILVLTFGRSVFAILLFVLINSNLFLFEFWSYSRGYGLAVAMMAGSIYGFLAFLKRRKIKLLMLSMAFGVLSVWSNFSLLNFYLALLAALAAGQVRFRLIAWKQLLLIAGGSSAILFLLVYLPLSKLVHSGELYYGGTTGLVADTITTLVTESYYTPAPDAGIVNWIVMIALGLNGISVLYYGYAFVRNDLEHPRVIGMMLCLIFNVILASIWMQHQLLGTKYLINRTALFLVPLFYLHISCFLYGILVPVRAVRLGLFCILAGLSVIRFAGKLSLHRSRTWWMDNYNVAVLERLAAQSNREQRPLNLRLCWIQMPSIDYYIFTRFSRNFVPPIYDKDPPGAADTQFDYCYLPREDATIISGMYEIDTIYDGNFLLFKKKQ